MKGYYKQGLGVFFNFISRWHFTKKQMKRLIIFLEIGLKPKEIYYIIKHYNLNTKTSLTEVQVNYLCWNYEREQKIKASKETAQ